MLNYILLATMPSLNDVYRLFIENYVPNKKLSKVFDGDIKN